MPVTQYKLTGEVVCSYYSIRAAANATGINEANISSCINGKQLTSGGYVWKKGKHRKRLSEDAMELIKNKNSNNQPKPVYKICPITKKILNSYNSISEAAMAVNSSNTSDISMAAKNRKSICRGFLWRYK